MISDKVGKHFKLCFRMVQTNVLYCTVYIIDKPSVLSFNFKVECTNPAVEVARRILAFYSLTPY